MALIKNLTGNSRFQILDPNSKLLYLIFLMRYDTVKQNCWPSIEQLRDDTGLSRSTIIRTIKHLRAYGLLIKLPGRPEHGNHYRVLELN